MAVKTYPKNDTTKLSKNFSVYEFRCGLGRGCNCTTTLIDDDLPKILQAIRDALEKAHPEKEIKVQITSGYRCPSYNSSTKGAATKSKHTQGMAADIVVPGIPPREVAQTAESLGVKRIGLYETDKDGHFVHVDTGTVKAFWYGQAQAYRSTFGGKPGTATTTPSSSTTTSSEYTLEQFVRDVQKATGAGVDGIAGPKTLAKTVTISKSKNKRHGAVLAVQKRLKALGYTVVGKADGIAGNKFDEALKAYQFDHDCVVDGEATARGETWAKLLGLQ